MVATAWSYGFLCLIINATTNTTTATTATTAKVGTAPGVGFVDVDVLDVDVLVAVGVVTGLIEVLVETLVEIILTVPD